MIQLHDKDTGTWIGTITEDNLQYLIDQLEEESGVSDETKQTGCPYVCPCLMD